MRIFKYIALLVLASTIQADNMDECKFYDTKLKEYYIKCETAEVTEYKFYSKTAYKHYVNKLEECYTNFDNNQSKLK